MLGKNYYVASRRFVGYIVGDRKFGCGQFAEAEAYSKKTGLPIHYFGYKI